MQSDVYEKYQVRSGKCQIDGGMGRKMDEMIAYCGEYACERLEKFFISGAETKKRLDKIRSRL